MLVHTHEKMKQRFVFTGQVDVDGLAHYHQLDFTLKQQVFFSVKAIEESLAFSLRLPLSFSEETTGLLGKRKLKRHQVEIKNT